jgi:hypothetical protein
MGSFCNGRYTFPSLKPTRCGDEDEIGNPSLGQEFASEHGKACTIMENMWEIDKGTALVDKDNALFAGNLLQEGLQIWGNDNLIYQFNPGYFCLSDSQESMICSRSQLFANSTKSLLLCHRGSFQKHLA